MAETNTDLANIDIYGLIRRLDRMVLELGLSQSADQSNGLLSFDVERLKDYIADYKSYLSYVVGLPIPDSPEAHGVWRKPLPPEADLGRPVEEVSNDDVVQIVMQLQIYRMEMANCQSARMIQGFHSFDTKRFQDGIVRIENFALNYVGPTQPSDKPESSPSGLPVKPGKLGT